MNTKTLFRASLLTGFAVLGLATAPACAAKTGQATFYGYSGGGNCMLPVPGDVYTAAINGTDYQGSKACGGYVLVKNSDTGQTVKVRIDDQCPGCPAGNLDLSAEAFKQIADPAQGIINISWKYVPYDQPSMQLFIADGSSQYYTAVQVRHHRYRINKLQYRLSAQGGAWTTVARTDYNYFVKQDGMGPGPYDFRLTDVNKQVVVVPNVPLQTGVEIETGKQFPVYAP